MKKLDALKKELQKYINPEKQEIYLRFFKTGPGDYGEGDRFIGVTVPNLRKVAAKFHDLSYDSIVTLLNDPVHEHRFVALVLLINRLKMAPDEQKHIVDIYLANISGINNWDLVDLSAHNILGPYLYKKDTELLTRLLKSGDLWKQRIAIMTTFHFIRNNSFSGTLKIAKVLLTHEHDLIHKAVGWMLREIGKRDMDVERKFLIKHYKKMPRTMLRYAIEKFEEKERQRYLKGLV